MEQLISQLPNLLVHLLAKNARTSSSIRAGTFDRVPAFFCTYGPINGPKLSSAFASIVPMIGSTPTTPETFKSALRSPRKSSRAIGNSGIATMFVALPSCGQPVRSVSSSLRPSGRKQLLSAATIAPVPQSPLGRSVCEPILDRINHFTIAALDRHCLACHRHTQLVDTREK